MGFCKDFNARTQGLLDGVPVPTVISVFADRSFTYETRSPPASYFLKKAAGLERGARRPGHETAGTVSLKHIHAIAEVKRKDPGMSHLPLESVCSQLVATAKSMGIRVVPRPEDA